MRRLMVCGALALLLLGGCTVAPAPYYDRPYAAPSYGQWRWDDDLGLYVSIGSPYLYYADHTYYRWSDRYWIAAPRYNGPWRTIDRRQVPSRLERRYYPGYPGRRIEESHERFERRVEPRWQPRDDAPRREQQWREQPQWREPQRRQDSGRENARPDARQEWRERFEQRRQPSVVPGAGHPGGELRRPSAAPRQPAADQMQPRRWTPSASGRPQGSGEAPRQWRQDGGREGHARPRDAGAGERRGGAGQMRPDGGARRWSAPTP